jgi:hypothetical protein
MSIAPMNPEPPSYTEELIPLLFQNQEPLFCGYSTACLAERMHPPGHRGIRRSNAQRRFNAQA